MKICCKTNSNTYAIVECKRNKPKMKGRQKRRKWDYDEEERFLEVWKRYLTELRGERKHAHVYRDMAAEFQDLGIEVKLAEIKPKMESLKRKFKTERDAEKPSRWEFYEQMAEIVGPLEAVKFEAFSDEPSISSSARSLDSDYFEEGSTKRHTEAVNKSTSNVGLVTSTEEICKSNGTLEDFEELYDDESTSDEPPVKKIKKEQRKDTIDSNKAINQYEDEKPDTHTRGPDKETFGELVTKELEMLDTDLLILAKRKIYSIICDIQIAQLQRNEG
ncbi:uncharacterized protein LOC115625083 [Scaptodrosophila lebanonensis]|uniref:Uncharacterized protein LOC115625083 n=1 Tax=Drosophila lebanonensis TaxID=7225 RepID=A0A6J2TIJ7_DROLE|nr:uncharacterized protein LOC115625083 [Scaptodrosophila lebanonensis]